MPPITNYGINDMLANQKCDDRTHIAMDVVDSIGIIQPTPHVTKSSKVEASLTNDISALPFNQVTLHLSKHITLVWASVVALELSSLQTAWSFSTTSSP